MTTFVNPPPSEAPLHGILREKLLTETEAANHLRLSVGTLRNWRWQRSGPTFIKVGRSVRYAESDLTNFMRRSITA